MENVLNSGVVVFQIKFIKFRRYALLTGPKRCKYLRAQIDLDRQTSGQKEESEMLGNGQQVLLVRSTYTKFCLKTSFILVRNWL